MFIIGSAGSGVVVGIGVLVGVAVGSSVGVNIGSIATELVGVGNESSVAVEVGNKPRSRRTAVDEAVKVGCGVWVTTVTLPAAKNISATSRLVPTRTIVTATTTNQSCHLSRLWLGWGGNAAGCTGAGETGLGRRLGWRATAG